MRNDPDFWANADKSGECWLWTGRLTSHATHRYGRWGKREYAHRVAYRLVNGDPGGADVLHECDNPRCVNPAHLKLGTHSQNMCEMFARERNRTMKVMAADIPRIHALRSRGMPQTSIAAELGVHQSQISRALHRRTVASKFGDEVEL